MEPGLQLKKFNGTWFTIEKFYASGGDQTRDC